MSYRTRVFVGAWFLALWASALGVFARPPVLENSLTITEQEGREGIDYPVQVARPFLEGEIPDFPQAVVDGAPVLTQADVKQRWSDGSVKHAILAFLVPRLPARGAVIVTFQRQASGHNDEAPSAADMLSPEYDFDATMELSNNAESRSVSARDMLAAGSFVYWTRGPVATTILLADHSDERRYDLGFDAYRPFRPIFHATFFPASGRVLVRFIGEIANTEALEDMGYSLTLRLGAAQPTEMYRKDAVVHHAASRWTVMGWLGEAPSVVKIDHNLPYVIATRFLPNFDTSKTVPDAVVQDAYADWTRAPQDLFDAGSWNQNMPEGGGRPDIGPYPVWTVRWLYTFDPWIEEQAFGNADLAAAWPMHYREGNPAKSIDREATVPGIGRVLSISTRPTLCIYYLGDSYAYTSVEDRIAPVGAMTDGGWHPDVAHQPDPFSPQYALTGDFWYLEEMHFWAAWTAATNVGGNPPYESVYYSRGPTGAEGGLIGEVRGEAWAFRSRAQTAFLTPDDMPEKAYFERLVADVIAMWEGVRDIRGTRFEGTAEWSWANTTGMGLWEGLGPSPLHVWEWPNPYILDWPLTPQAAGAGTCAWMNYFLIYALGRGRELGYPTEALLTWASDFLTRQIIDPSYDPSMAEAYETATCPPGRLRWFQTWAEVRTGFAGDYDARGWFENRLTWGGDSYPYYLLAASSMVADQHGGAQAWTWVRDRVLDRSELDSNPQYAILPR